MNTNQKLRQSVRLHDEATELADEAFFARQAGDEEAYLRYTRQALDKEAESATLLRHDTSHHMYAILHRSAATLAYRCGEFRVAEDLIANGLVGAEDERVRDELHELLTEVQRKVRLERKDELALSDELVMAMKGIESDDGHIEFMSFSRRIEKLGVLILNTIGLLEAVAFQSLSRIKRDFRVLASPPAYGSFRVGMRVAYLGKTKLLESNNIDDVYSTILNNLSLLNDGNIQQLRDRFRDDRYFHNFVELAIELAPDGERVSSVSMKSRIRGEVTTSTIDRTQEDMRLLAIQPAPENDSQEYTITDHIETVTGELKYADSMLNAREVRLVADDGRVWIIVVPIDRTEAIVKEHFGDRVTVIGRHIKKKRKSRRLHMDGIEPSQSRRGA